MDNKLLKAAFAPENFRERGHRLIDELADHLDAQIHQEATKTLHWKLPENEYDFWKDFLANGDESVLFAEIIKHTTNVQNPKCIGHQVAPPAPVTALSGLIGSLQNNGTAVYEMGMASNAIERVITELLCKKIGYDQNSNGFLTSGGTLANLTALLTARKAKVPHDVWNKGTKDQLGILVSEEAHYCIERAAKIMGLGEQGIIKVPSTKNFTMDISVLEDVYHKATKTGIHIFAAVGSAPVTATGMLDDLEAIANFSEKYNLWYHVDAAHGGAALFSSKYAKTLKGIEKSDSVVVDGHKMMMMPGITTALLYKNGNSSYATFSQKADYLLDRSTEQDWYNSGKRTFECTKNMMAIHWYTLLKTYGETIFDANVTTLYDLGKLFGEMIQDDPQFELAVAPMTNIVCFRYYDDGLETRSLNKLNKTIRRKMLEEGEFYIVQTDLRGIHYLRCTIMNPFTAKEHLRELLKKIKGIADFIGVSEW